MVKKLEKELKKTLTVMEEEHEKHKQVAILLVSERKQLVQRLLAERQKCTELTVAAQEQKEKYENAADRLMEESQRALKMEAAYEKLQAEHDSDNKLWKAKIEKEEEKNRQLVIEVESLSKQLDSLKSSHEKEEVELLQKLGGVPSTVVSSKMFQKPVVSQAELNKPAVVSTPNRDVRSAGSSSSKTSYHLSSTQHSRANVVQKTFVSHPAPSKATPVPSAPTPPVRGSTHVTAPKPVPASKLGFNINSSSPRPPDLPPKQGSLGGGLGRVPPPVPPNKPVLKPGTQRVGDSSLLPENLVKSPSSPVKLGLISKDRLGMSSPDSSSGHLSVVGPNTNQTNPNISTGGAGKTPQVGELDIDENLDIFGPELADLQQLLVSMVTGKRTSEQQCLWLCFLSKF